MIDMRLFTHRIILSGVVMAMTAMITLVGFELLMAQELQFVHGLTPYQAGLFMLPVMLAKWFQRTDCRYETASGLGLRCARRRVPPGACRTIRFGETQLAMTYFG